MLFLEKLFEFEKAGFLGTGRLFTPYFVLSMVGRLETEALWIESLRLLPGFETFEFWKLFGVRDPGALAPFTPATSDEDFSLLLIRLRRGFLGAF